MYKLHISNSPRHPDYLVRIYVNILGNVTKDDEENLKELRNKLEQIIPGNLRVRYTLSADQLVVITKVKSAAEALRMNPKLTEYIRAAAAALKLRI